MWRAALISVGSPTTATICRKDIFLNSETVTALTSIEAVIADYDLFLVDQWGVIHEGHAVYPGAQEALQMIKQAGKTTLILREAW